MNKIYKVVWSKVKNCYVVVSEIAKNIITGGVKSAKVGAAPMAKGLALGAAMAFVITGNVWAADISGITEDVQVVHGIANYDGLGTTNVNASKDKSWTLGSKTLWIDEHSGSQGGWGTFAVATDYYSFVGDENSTLKVVSSNNTKLTDGLAIAGNINVGTLTVDVQRYGVKSFGTTTVTANDIVINSDWGYGLQAAEGAKINVKAKDSMNLTGGAAAAFVDGISNISVESYGTDKADIVINGDVYSYGGSIDLKLETKDSSFTGASILYGDKAQVNVTLDNGATWVVTDDSTITGLAGKDAHINSAEIKKAVTDNVTVTINNSGKYHYPNNVLKDTVVELEGVDLVVNSATTGKDTMGMLSNAHITSDGTVSINQNGNDAALGYYSKDSISAKVININSAGVGAYAVYSANATDEHILSADEININSNGRSILNQDGTVEITADKLTVTSDRSVEGKANNAITANGKGAINVNADEVTLFGGIDVLNTDEAEVNFKSADGSSTVKVMQITGDINAKKGTLSGMELSGSESFIEGTINTIGNDNAAVSFSDGATWKVNGKSEVQEFAGEEGIIVVDEKILGTAGAVTIAENTSEGTVVKAAGISLQGGAKKALSGLEQDLKTTVIASGEELVYQAAVIDTELRGDVELMNGKVITVSFEEDAE